MNKDFKFADKRDFLARPMNFGRVADCHWADRARCCRSLWGLERNAVPGMWIDRYQRAA
jgi:hypothetical protein